MGKEKKPRDRRLHRLFDLLAELLINPGPHRIAEKAKQHNVSPEQLRKDLNFLIHKLNEANSREYIVKEHGKYRGNFTRAVVNLKPDLRLYLFLALQQVRPILEGEGKRAYAELEKIVYSFLPESDREKLELWKNFYTVNTFGFPKERSQLYQDLNEIFFAIILHQKLTFQLRGKERFFDPYAVYYAKHSFYLIGEFLESSEQQKKKQNKLALCRLDRVRALKRMQGSFSPLKYELKKNADTEIYRYKIDHAKAFLDKILEAEYVKEKHNYRFFVLEEKAWIRIQEKEWMKGEKIIPVNRWIDGRWVYGEVRFPGAASWVEMKKWVLGWGTAILVIEPKEFRREIEEEIRKMYKLYSDKIVIS